jgi:hypothetical protein
MQSMVAGKSDAQLLETAAQFGGPPAVIESIVRGLADAVGPTAPDALVGFVAQEGEVRYCHAVRVISGTASVEPLAESEADTVYTSSFPDLVRIAAGVLELPTAVGDGRVRVSGDAELGDRVLLSLT